MNFVTAMRTVLVTRATDINGRSDRPEFWWFTLYATISMLALMAGDHDLRGVTVDSLVDPCGETKDSGVLSALFILGTLVQSICLSARRLHDRGHSGWWQILYIVPFLNVIPLYWTLRDAKDTPSALNYKNPYGSR